MTTRSVPILFIGGSGLTAWIWDDVRRHLGDRPLDRVAARPASGEQASLEEYVDAAIGSAPAGKFLVVAHSSGGVIGAEVARRVSDRVKGFLAVSAVIPAPGGSFIGAMPIPNRWILGVMMRMTSTRPPASVIRRGLAYGLPEEITRRIIEEFVPESDRLYRDRTGTGPLEVESGYVFTTADREFPLKLQQQSAQRLGARWTSELSTGHLPMIEDPQEMAEVVIRYLER